MPCLTRKVSLGAWDFWYEWSRWEVLASGGGSVGRRWGEVICSKWREQVVRQGGRLWWRGHDGSLYRLEACITRGLMRGLPNRLVTMTKPSHRYRDTYQQSPVQRQAAYHPGVSPPGNRPITRNDRRLDTQSSLSGATSPQDGGRDFRIVANSN